MADLILIVFTLISHHLFLALIPAGAHDVFSSIKCGECPCEIPCTQQPPPPTTAAQNYHPPPPPPRFVYMTGVAPPSPQRFIYTSPGDWYSSTDPFGASTYSPNSQGKPEMKIWMSLLVVYSALHLLVFSFG